MSNKDLLNDLKEKVKEITLKEGKEISKVKCVIIEQIDLKIDSEIPTTSNDPIQHWKGFLQARVYVNEVYGKPSVRLYRITFKGKLEDWCKWKSIEVENVYPLTNFLNMKEQTV